MQNYNRDLLVLFRPDIYSEDLLQKEVEGLHKILLRVEKNDVFCIAHELITRTRITSKARLILKAVSNNELKPFHFLFNKN